MIRPRQILLTRIPVVLPRSRFTADLATALAILVLVPRAMLSLLLFCNTAITSHHLVLPTIWNRIEWMKTASDGLLRMIATHPKEVCRCDTERSGRKVRKNQSFPLKTDYVEP